MFKSSTIYQMTQATNAVIHRLTPALAELPFTECGKSSQRSVGFVPPLGGDSEEMTYETNGDVLFCLRTDEKSVPASFVKEQVTAAVSKRIAAGEDLSVVDERLIKKEIIEKLLPGIPPAPSRTYAYIDKKLGMLFVDASAKGADEFMDALKKALKGIPFTLLGIQDDPSEKFTAWVKDSDLLGHCFTLGANGSLKHPGMEGGCGVINAKHEDFESPEFLSLIDAGRQVCSIALKHERMDFRLTASLGLRNIALSEQAKAESFNLEEGVVTVDYEFAAVVTALRAVMGSLEPLLGGWPTQELLDLGDEQQENAA